MQFRSEHGGFNIPEFVQKSFREDPDKSGGILIDYRPASSTECGHTREIYDGMNWYVIIAKHVLSWATRLEQINLL